MLNPNSFPTLERTISSYGGKKKMFLNISSQKKNSQNRVILSKIFLLNRRGKLLHNMMKVIITLSLTSMNRYRVISLFSLNDYQLVLMKRQTIIALLALFIPIKSYPTILFQKIFII